LDMLLKDYSDDQCAESTLEEVFVKLHSETSEGNNE